MLPSKTTYIHTYIYIYTYIYISVGRYWLAQGTGYKSAWLENDVRIPFPDERLRSHMRMDKTYARKHFSKQNG